MAIIKCQDCGKEISSSAEKCIHCGCPIVKVDMKDVNTTKKRSPLVKILIIGLVALVAILGFKAIQSIMYQQNLNTICYEIIQSAAHTEKCCNQIHDVWYNTIFEVPDETTDKYTMNDGVFNADFNDSLSALYDDEDFINDVNDIKYEQEYILDLMKKLNNPPAKYKESYKHLNELYEEYIKFSNMAIDPTGNLYSYTEEYNESDEILVDKFEKMKIYID